MCGRDLTMWMPRISHGLLAIELRIRVEEFWHWAKELTIAVNGSREGLRKPIQCRTVEHLIHRWSFIGPLLELLSDPD